jgi:hypothetical protein
MASPMGGGILEIAPPIIVVEGNDIYVYPSVVLCERHLEACDVDTDVYQAFDSRGRAIRLGVVNGRVTIRGATRSPAGKTKVVAALRGYLPYARQYKKELVETLEQICLRLESDR